MNSPMVGSVGPVPSQSISSKVREQLTFKKSLADPPAEVQSYLGGCILLTNFWRTQVRCLPQMLCVAHVQALLKPKFLRASAPTAQGGGVDTSERG